MPRLTLRPTAALLSAVLALSLTSPLSAQSAARSTATNDRLARDARRLVTAALADTIGFSRLATMVDRFGARPAGSAALEGAIDWLLDMQKRDGFDGVRGEPAMVPHWVRGNESAALVLPRATRLHLLGLGGTVATPAGGITAPVLVVTNFDDLRAHAAQARGRIVLFDVPFSPKAEPFAEYGRVVRYRGLGADSAASFGAVAMLLRSVTPHSLQSPHTGGMRYGGVQPKIPAAALSVEDAEMLHRMQNRGDSVVVHLETSGRMLPDAPSRNAVAEIRGSTHPDEIIVMGGHIDSWDVGQGAMDDAGGVVAAWEALRLIKALGLKPKRTIRVVGWTNEEFGGRGGQAYKDTHESEVGKHVVAIESDNGVFRPYGFRFQGSPAGLAVMKALGARVLPAGMNRIVAGEGEADVDALITAGVPGLALDVDPSRYFYYHHTEADMMTALDRDDFNRCVAVLAAMAYALAETDVTPEHTTPKTSTRRR